MDPLSPAVLAKVAGPVASRFGMSALQKLTRGRRVARAAAKRAAAAGVPIRAKSLRVWLSRADTAHQLRQCTESSLEQAAQRLVYVVPGRDAEQRHLDALRVLRIVMEEYVRSVSPQEAALFTSEWERQSAVEDGAGPGRQSSLPAMTSSAVLMPVAALMLPCVRSVRGRRRRHCVCVRRGRPWKRLWGC